MKMKMLLGLVFVIFSLQAEIVHAVARERMTGTTQIEREIRWGWKYLKDVTTSCLESKTECQDEEIRKVVREIDTYLPSYESAEAAAWAELLSFVSERDHPCFYFGRRRNSSAGDHPAQEELKRDDQHRPDAIAAEKLDRHSWT